MNPGEEKEKTAMVLEIQRMSTEDGPGIRTTVFFKGCSLGCTWCHNPESISARAQLQWIGNRCIGCHSCLTVCPEKALSASPDGIIIDRGRCKGCGTCAEECPSTALEIMGKTWTVDDLVHEVLKDRVYFETSGGGITASGGEAALQADFVADFFKRCRAQGVHTALDTCGQVSWQAYEKILPHTDLLLFDMKLIDSEEHRRYTGKGNKKILENLLFIRGWREDHGCPDKLWIRTPVIPGATDSEENIAGIGEFIHRHLADGMDRWELCAFNNLCRDKYSRLDLNWAFHDAKLMTEARMTRLCALARSRVDDPERVQWSGSVRSEEAVCADEPERSSQPALRIIDGCRADG
ncbi:MAG: glycyl-radical enzyme activating protein [Desulfobacterales bacterium]|nr:glycyl-radical enzyme activating protein [Desulfobacterales bacterium]